MWNQHWGSMIWGGGSRPVPFMGPLGLMLLAMMFMVLDAIVLRNPVARRRLGTALAFAHVNATGTIDSDSGNITVFKAGAGTYCAAVSGGTPKVVVATLDARANVGGSVQTSVFVASVCPVEFRQIFITTRPHNQDGGSPGQDRAFYLFVN